MAAYASLASLMHILDQLQHHPLPPIFFDKQEVESLIQIVAFLQKFLEGYISPVAYGDKADPLEKRIAYAASAAEDAIGSYIVDNIRWGPLDYFRAPIGEEIVNGEETSSVFSETQSTKIWFFNCFRGPKKSKKEGKEIENESRRGDNEIFQGDIIFRNFGNLGLRTVIEEIDAIKEEASKETRRVQARQRTFSTPAASVTSNKMVGFDQVFLEMLDKLQGGQDDCLQIIPIVGMGGIGKTTLARNIYAAPLIKEHFDVCAWTTVSQEYDARRILREVLGGQNKHAVDSSVDELGETLHIAP